MSPFSVPCRSYNLRHPAIVDHDSPGRYLLGAGEDVVKLFQIQFKDDTLVFNPETEKGKLRFVALPLADSRYRPKGGEHGEQPWATSIRSPSGPMIRFRATCYCGRPGSDPIPGSSVDLRMKSRRSSLNLLVQGMSERV
jgi:hypothetical protein